MAEKVDAKNKLRQRMFEVNFLNPGDRGLTLEGP